jgi:hypothetical protein
MAEVKVRPNGEDGWREGMAERIVCIREADGRINRLSDVKGFSLFFWMAKSRGCPNQPTVGIERISTPSGCPNS